MDKVLKLQPKNDDFFKGIQIAEGNSALEIIENIINMKGFKVTYYTKTIEADNSVGYFIDNEMRICSEYDEITQVKTMINLWYIKEFSVSKKDFIPLVENSKYKNRDKEVTEFICNILMGARILQ